MPTFQTVLRGHVTAADKAQQDYAYIPFDLPQPAHRLHVRMSILIPSVRTRRKVATSLIWASSTHAAQRFLVA